MAEDNLKINVEAESKALTPLVESENFISYTEKVKNSFLKIETPETLMMSAKSEPVVEAEPKTSPKIENISSIVEQDKNKILAIKTQNLEQLVDKNLIPAISKMYKDITNRINNDKDPKEALERRPTFGLHNLVFDDRLNRLTDAPFWV